MATPTKEITVGDVGTEIRLQFTELVAGVVTPVPIGTALDAGGVLQFEFVKPEGGSASKAAAFTTDGSDGFASFFSPEGFFDEAGTWAVCGVVRIPGAIPPGGKWTSNTYRFPVARGCRPDPGPLTPAPVVLSLSAPDPTVT